MSKDTVEEKEMDHTRKGTMDETNPDRAFQEETLRMAAAKGAMTKKVKRLETALKELKDIHGMASEVDESKSAVKEAYTKMELINEVIVRKLIVLDRSEGVFYVEKSMEELNNALE